jgi:hypothetical protein
MPKLGGARDKLTSIFGYFQKKEAVEVKKIPNQAK